MKRKAIVIGATGLVGKYLLKQLGLMYDRLIIVARQQPDTMCPKMEFYQLADFNNLAEVISTIALDSKTDAFTCLGSTLKQAGSKDAFKEIDYQYNLTFATACVKKGVNQFFLLSAHNADRQSHFFYNQVKGELEEAIIDLDFSKVYIFRPSLLLGHHRGRPLETITQMTYKLVSPLVPKSLNVRPISAERVAAAMAITAHNLYERQRYSGNQRTDSQAFKPYDKHTKTVKIIDNRQMLAMTQL